MSRVHSNIAEFCGRRLVKQFNSGGTAWMLSGGAKAIGITAPTSLGGQEIAMGQAGKNGVVSFIVTDGGNQAFTIYEYDSDIAKIQADRKAGWILNGANAAEYTKTCDQLAKISFTISEGAEFFILAGTTPCTEAKVSGSESANNPNTDISLGTQR